MDTKIGSDLWDDESILELSPSAKLAWFWLLTCHRINICGYVEVSPRVFTFQTGCPPEALTECLEGLGAALVTTGKGYWLRNFIGRQFGRSKKLGNNNLAKAICKKLDSGSAELRGLVLREYPELQPVFDKMNPEGLHKGSPTPPEGVRAGERERERVEKGESPREGVAGAVRNCLRPSASHGGVAPEPSVIPTVGGSRGHLPESLDCPEFADLWERWRLHWAESFGRGRAMPMATEDSQLRTLAGVGPAEAIKWVENAIEKGLRTPCEPFRNSHGGGKVEPSVIPTEGVARDRLAALADACGGSLTGPNAPTASGLQELGTALAEIKAASPNVKPEEIAARAARYRRKFSGVTVTARGLAKHWGTLAGPVERVVPQEDLPEPEDWRQYLREYLPDCAFAPGQSREAKKWSDIDVDGQKWITEDMKDQKREVVVA